MQPEIVSPAPRPVLTMHPQQARAPGLLSRGGEQEGDDRAPACFALLGLSPPAWFEAASRKEAW